MAKRNNKEMFNIPEMSNYDANEDAKQYKKTKEALEQEDNLDGMDFEAMKGEETYVSPEEASPEALKKIKAMINPRKVETIKMDGNAITEDTISSVNSFMSVYLIILNLMLPNIHSHNFHFRL